MARRTREPTADIPVTSGAQLRSGIPIITGFMPAGVLIPDRYVIPYHSPTTRKGYQRPPQLSRINELVTDLRRGRVDLPTAVLLNIRNRNANEAVNGGALQLDALTDASRRDAKFYVVDGQHRVLALARLLEELPEQWHGFLIPFVCMLGANEDQEMEQFHVVNSKAKSVRTDLALALLKQRAEKHPEVMEQLLERGRDWQIKAQQLVERLADSSNVWKTRIRMPAMEKAGTTIASASMVTSLKPLLQSPYFGALTLDAQQRVLEAYWQGLREEFRPAFDEPEKYVIQKGIGVILLHAVLVYVIELIKSRGLSVTDPNAYGEIMREPLQQLEGDNLEGLPVNGIDFWKVAPEGAAGSYSSNAARRVLVVKLRQLLPTVEVE